VKFVTFTHNGRTRIGELDGDRVYASAWSDTMFDVIQRGITPSRVSEHYPLAEVKLEAPLRPGKTIAIGRNYVEHAAELGNEPPAAPVIFAKFSSSSIGNGDTITWNKSTTQEVDWEGELGVIIGRKARHVREADAYRHVFGYTIANDISARDIQHKQDTQWIRGKNLDTFFPLGPCITTAKAIPDPHDLELTTSVNGEVMQQSSTANMIFKIPFLIAYCSRMFTLEPGDMIITGTPAGVGKGMNPPRFLQDGDRVTVSISGIGELTNTCQVLD
jgi:2-keto-4-pentenoate hydratase/2-oxohepta-3-ene-1,7-dioic acid hydratase in catechol pathway